MTEKQIQEYINLLSDDELRIYVQGLIKEEPEFGCKLCAHAATHHNDINTDNIQFAVDCCFGRLETSVGRKKRAWLSNWDTVELQSNKLFEHANNAISSAEPDIALAIGIRWLENFALFTKESHLYDDVFKIRDEFERDKQDRLLHRRLSEQCQKAVFIIDEAIAYPNVSEEVIQDVSKRLEWFTQPLGPNLSYHCTHFAGLPSRVKAFCLPPEDTLKFLDSRLEYNFNDATLLKQKYRLLLKMGLENEAETFAQDNIDNYEFADVYVQDLRKAKRFEKLISVLRDLTDPQYETTVRPTSRWLELLAECQDNLKLEDEAIETYRSLFILTKGDMKYYHILRQRVSSEQWPQFLEQMVQQTKFPSYNTSGKDNYADLLVMEGRFQALHDWLKNRKDENTFAFYLPYIPKELRSDIFPVYCEKLLAIADKAGKREEYARIANLIVRIKELPEGEEVALNIAKKLKVKYPRKSMLIGELRRVLGLNRL